MSSTFPTEGTGCPSREELLDFVSGRVAADTLEAIGRHLACCPDCAARLSALEAGDDTLLHAVRRAVAHGIPEEASECRRLEARARQIRIGPGDDPNEEAGVVTSVFNTTDPLVRRRIFGIARLDLASRNLDFTPVGPAVTGMTGLRLTPDRKTGYTVAYLGSPSEPTRRARRGRPWPGSHA